ncbi:MAG: hypothetical protein IJD91_08580 [Clostridia bacterium]|nr:hypothetical protein [Clostridia bacterium]
MKVGKDGKLKLSKDERQIGNFVYKNEPEHIKICDINSQMTHRVAKHLNIGRMLEMALKEKKDQYLANYAAMTWLYSNIVTDEQFFLDIDKACVACVNRHKEFYGIKEDITPDADNEILEESKEVYGAIEELKKEE